MIAWGVFLGRLLVAFTCFSSFSVQGVASQTMLDRTVLLKSSVGLLPESVISISTKPSAGDDSGPSEPLIELDLISASEGKADFNPVVEDLAARVDEWSEVTLDFGELNLETYKSKETTAKSVVKVGEKEVPFVSMAQSKPLFFSVSEVGGESIAGKKVSVDQASCELYPTVPTGNANDKLSCEGLFQVSSTSECKWDEISYSLDDDEVAIGALSCKTPKIVNSIGYALASYFNTVYPPRTRGAGIAALNEYSYITFSCVDIVNCSITPYGAPMMISQRRLDAVTAIAKKILGNSKVSTSFTKSFSAEALGTGGLTFGLRKVKFKINPGARVSGVSYVGNINMNVKAL